MAHGFEASVAKLVHQDFDWHSILQCDRQSRTEAIHDSTDGGSLFGHGDKDLAGASIWIEANAEVSLVARNRELMSDALTCVMKPFSSRLVNDLFFLLPDSY